MKKYFVLDSNFTLIARDILLIKRLTEEGVKQIKIPKCKETRYECKKKRTAILRKKILNEDTIYILDLIHLGRSYTEIYSWIEKKTNTFYYVQLRNAPNDFFDVCKKNAGKPIKFCDMNCNNLSQARSSITKYLKIRSIKQGITDSKNKVGGRITGAKNKRSVYEPYKEKIIEARKEEMSVQGIIKHIGFGTKSGLTYYIKNNLT